MMRRAVFVAGAAVGYVLGSRAGRERYEQLKQASRRMTENPTVQETAGLLRAQAEEMAGTAKEKVNTKIHSSKLGERLPGVHGADPQHETVAGHGPGQRSAPAMP